VNLPARDTARLGVMRDQSLVQRPSLLDPRRRGRAAKPYDIETLGHPAGFKVLALGLEHTGDSAGREPGPPFFGRVVASPSILGGGNYSDQLASHRWKLTCALHGTANLMLEPSRLSTRPSGGRGDG
jgi:hypothetical protein